MKTPPSLAKCSLELRPYQQSIIDVSIEHFRKSGEPIIIDGCVGSGKTLIISHMARHVVNKGGRVISLAHTKELVESAYFTFLDYAQDMECGVFSAGMGRKDTEHDVTFCSEKTLINGLDKFQPIDLLIIDEAHRVNDSNIETCYLRIISHFQEKNPKLRILGLTGTSFRTMTGPIAGPDKLFKKIIATVSVPELVEQGYLTKPIAPLNQEAYDFSGVKLVAGKFSEADLEAAVSDVRLTKSLSKNKLYNFPFSERDLKVKPRYPVCIPNFENRESSAVVQLIYGQALKPLSTAWSCKQKTETRFWYSRQP